MTKPISHDSELRYTNPNAQERTDCEEELRAQRCSSQRNNDGFSNRSTLCKTNLKRVSEPNNLAGNHSVAEFNVSSDVNSLVSTLSALTLVESRSRLPVVPKEVLPQLI